MIVGIGTDLVQVARIAASLERYGERFATRILSAEEMQAMQAAGSREHFLAKRFAAKEAAVKALGTGFRDGISLRSVTVSNTDLGQPRLEFTGAAKSRCEALGVTASHLSLSDEREHALAFVVLEAAD